VDVRQGAAAAEQQQQQQQQELLSLQRFSHAGRRHKDLIRMIRPQNVTLTRGTVCRVFHCHHVLHSEPRREPAGPASYDVRCELNPRQSIGVLALLGAMPRGPERHRGGAALPQAHEPCAHSAP
jgi:hypothetical protein